VTPAAQLGAALGARAHFFDTTAFFLLATAIFLSPMRNWTVTRSLELSDLAFALAAIPCLLSGVRKARLTLPPLLMVSGVLFAVSQFFVAWDPEAQGDWKRFGQYLLASCAIPLLIAAPRYFSEQRVRLLAVIWVVAVVVSCLAGIARQHDIPLGPFTSYSAAPGGREAGLSGQATILALYLAMAAPFAFAFAMDAKRPLARMAWIAALAILFYVTNQTGSRIGLAAAAGATAGMAMLSEFRRSMSNILLGLLVVLMVGILVAYSVDWEQEAVEVQDQVQGSAVSRLFGMTDTSLADAEREEQQRTGIADFLSSPLYGVGFSHLTESHNIFIQFLQCAGLIGLVAFVLQLASAGLVYLRLARLSPGSRGPDAHLRLAIVMAVLAWIVYDLYQPVVQERGQYVPFGILYALAATLASRRAAPSLELTRASSSGAQSPRISPPNSPGSSPGRRVGRPSP
jgi:hypothetical protein